MWFKRVTAVKVNFHISCFEMSSVGPRVSQRDKWRVLLYIRYLFGNISQRKGRSDLERQDPRGVTLHRTGRLLKKSPRSWALHGRTRLHAAERCSRWTCPSSCWSRGKDQRPLPVLRCLLSGLLLGAVSALPLSIFSTLTNLCCVLIVCKKRSDLWIEDWLRFVYLQSRHSYLVPPRGFVTDSVVLPVPSLGKDQNSNSWVQFPLNMCHFHPVVNSKNLRLSHPESGTVCN